MLPGFASSENGSGSKMDQNDSEGQRNEAIFFFLYIYFPQLNVYTLWDRFPPTFRTATLQQMKGDLIPFEIC